MESLKSLRSLDTSGGPSGTGRSTSPLSPVQGTPERDFEADLAQARRVERRDERRERAQSAGERRAEGRRENRVDERREASARRASEAAEGPEAPALELEVPQADSPAVEPARAPEAGSPEETAIAREAAPTAQTHAEQAGGTPARGAGAAVEALPAPVPVWNPIQAQLPPDGASPTGDAPEEAPAGEGDVDGIAPVTAHRERSAGGEVGNDEAEPAPPTDPAARREAPDAPRSAERAGPAADAPANPVEARGASAPRAAEGARPVESPTPPPAPAAAPDAVEHAAAILRQVRLRLTAGTREATLQLEPARLGRLSIRLELRRGATRAEVVAEQPAALELLARHEPELRAALADAGFQGVEIELRHAGDGSGRDPFAALSAPPAPAARGEVREQLARILHASGGVDTYA